MVILTVVVCGKASFFIHDTCPFWPLHCRAAPLPPFHVQAHEALSGWEEGTYVPCVNFKCGNFAFWIVGHVPVRYLTHLVYVSGHHFVYSHVTVSRSCHLLEFYTNRGWLASSTLKGCTFLPCAFTVQKKYWFLNKYLFCPCLSLFRRIMWLLQSRMHLADTHLQFQKNITK